MHRIEVFLDRNKFKDITVNYSDGTIVCRRGDFLSKKKSYRFDISASSETITKVEVHVESKGESLQWCKEQEELLRDSIYNYF